jgi:transposase-like protein
VISKRIRERVGKKVSPRRLCAMANEVASHVKGSKELAREFHPQWTGYLQVDDKYINIRGKQGVSLVAVDGSGDPLHDELLREPTVECYEAFFRFVIERLDYPIRGITTDLDGRLLEAVARVCPTVPHQYCLWHLEEDLKRMLEYPALRRRVLQLQRKIKAFEEGLLDHKRWYDRSRVKQWEASLAGLLPQYQRQQEFLEALRSVLYEISPSVSRKRLQALRRRFGRDFARVLARVMQVLPGALAHQTHPGLARTNALAENINKQIKRRLSTIEAFQHTRTAAYLHLLGLYLRFKPYTDCRGVRRLRNGKSPIELCSVKLIRRDWLAHALRSCHTVGTVVS